MHELIRGIADDDRAHDPWGAGMGALGAVCDVLSSLGERVPGSAGYRPGVCGPDVTDPRAETLLAGLFPDNYPGYWVEGYVPDLDVDDLQHAAEVLSRYLDVVRLAGLDY